MTVKYCWQAKECPPFGEAGDIIRGMLSNSDGLSILFLKIVFYGFAVAVDYGI